MAGNKIVESLKAQYNTSTDINGFVHFELSEHAAQLYEAINDGGRSYHAGMPTIAGTLRLNDDAEADALCAFTTAYNLIHYYRTAAGAQRKETLKNCRFHRARTNAPELFSGGRVGESVVQVVAEVGVSDTIATMRVVANVA